MGLETKFSGDSKPRYALTSCWYRRLSRVNGKLVILDVGIKAYAAYLKIGMYYDAYILTIMTPMRNI